MKKDSFRKDLFIIFLICVSIPLILLSIVQAAYFNNKFIVQTETQFKNTLYSVSKNLQIYLDDLRYLSIAPLLNNDLLESMKQMSVKSPGYLTGETEAYSGKIRYSRIIQKLLYTSTSDVTGIVFIPNSGATSYYVNRNKITVNEINYPIADDDWIKQVIEAKGTPVLTKIHTAKYFENKQVFSVVRLIRDIDNRRDIGIIKVDASSNFIKDIFDNISISPNSVLTLVDEEQNIIYSNSSLSSRLMLANQNNSGTIRLDDDIYYVNSEDVPSCQWKFYYFTSKNDIVNQTNTIYYFALICFILCFLLGLALFKNQSKNMVNKVESIISGMQEIERGNLKTEIDVNLGSKDDLSKIALAFNQMTRKLTEHINREYRANLNLKAAEYAALQSQINPHFLNNTLSGFIALNRLGCRDKLEQSIISLTRLFRYTCSSQNTTTVKEELDFLEQYFFLQKLRFEEKFDYKITIKDGVENIVIPKLLIQPLAENSIIHAMEPSDNSVFISINAYKITTEGIGDCLTIVISDNGMGFDLDCLEEDKRVGLKSTQERLKLFNENSSFTITSSKNKGTTCVIAIKL